MTTLVTAPSPARPRSRARACEWTVARPPWRSMRPTIESRTPRRSAGTASAVEARAAIAHEDLDALALDLGEERDRLRARELRRVHQRLARGGDQRGRAVVERPVAHGDDLDRHVVVALDLGRGGLQRARERRRARPGACRSATPAARAPGGGRARRPRAGRRRASAPARASAGRESCRCAATSARSCERIRAARSAASPRTSRSHHGARMIAAATRITSDGQDHVARRGEHVVEPEEDQRAAEHQRDAHADPVDRRRAAAAPACARWRAPPAPPATGARSAPRPPPRSRPARRSCR